MSYAELFVGGLIIVLLILVAVRALAPKREEPNRTIWRDGRGNVVAIGERQGTPPGELGGRGTQTSRHLNLSPSVYAIDYHFEALTRVALLSDTGEDTLFIKSGVGSESFTIIDAGRCRLLVEPTDEGAAWSIRWRAIQSPTMVSEETDF